MLRKFFKRMLDDYCSAQNELKDMGMFTVYWSGGSYTHQVHRDMLSAYINTTDDKSSTIRKENTDS